MSSGKVPAVAAFLSALFPGLGQIYAGRWGKGAFFLAGTVVLIGWGGQSLSMEAVLAGEPSQLAGPLGISTLILGLVIWSMWDAYRSAKALSSGRSAQTRLGK